MTIQAEFDAAALELLTAFGKGMTYRVVGTSAYNPSTGLAVPSHTDIPVLAVVVDLTLHHNGLSVKYGTEIISGDKEAYVRPPIKAGGPALTPNPVTDQFITPDGTVYTVVTFKEVNPTGSDPILYSLYLRR